MERKLMTAKTYANWERIGEPYEQNGKLYTKVKDKCPRCSGLGIIVARVENDRLIPIPVDQGICYQCKGAKYITKKVRLYTLKEYNQMEASKEKTFQKKEEERKAKMLAEYNNKRKKWLEDNGFNENEITYVYFPSDSYEIKEKLKELGFRFNYTLLWHIAEVPEGYEDKVVEISLRDIAEVSAWGDAHYIEGAKDKVVGIMKAARPQPTHTSEWIGEVKDKFTDLAVTLVKVHGFTSKFGYSQIVVFETETGDLVKWFTAVNIPFESGDKLLLSGTIKELTEDKYEDNAHVTLVTRCKMQEAE